MMCIVILDYLQFLWTPRARNAETPLASERANHRVSYNVWNDSYFESYCYVYARMYSFTVPGYLCKERQIRERQIREQLAASSRQTERQSSKRQRAKITRLLARFPDMHADSLL